MQTSPRLILASLLLGFVTSNAPAEEARLLRFPAIQGDRIAFCYGGDIWTCSTNGGVARRVTSFDEGYEVYPRISPDGQWIAFSGEYSGTRQVYVVSFDGGIPKQLTFYPDSPPSAPRHGYDHLPMDWTPDGSKLLFRSCRTPYNGTIGKYFLIDPKAGGLEEPLEIPEGGPATFSPDGKKLAYNIISREWRTWKRYKAGRAQDVFLYDLEKHTVEQITNFEGTDNHPLYIGDRIYFTSDRTGTLNLYRFDIATRETRQVTDYKDFDVLWPSRGGDQIIYEQGGYLFVLDTKTDTTRKLTIELADDRPWLRPVWKDARGNLGSFDLSPSAKRAVVEVRGELFSVPAKEGETVNLTQTPARRERSVSWSPDGRSIAYIAEIGTEYEIIVRTFDGGPHESGTETQITSGTGAWILGMQWSPDSKVLAFSDKANRLNVVDIASKTARVIDTATTGTIDSFSWSGDSNWLTYSRPMPNEFNAIYVAAVGAGLDATPHRVTTDHYDHGSPAFDLEGRWLYFVSSRDFEYDGLGFQSRPYALLLRKDCPHPLAPKNDLEPKAKPEEPKKDEPKKEGDAKPEDKKEGDTAAKPEEKKDEKPAKPALVIDFDGIESRFVALPAPSGGYFGTSAVEGGFLIVHDGNLEKYDVEKREFKRVLDGIGNYSLTGDGKKLIYRTGGDLAIADAQPGQSVGSNKVALDDIRLKIDRQTEWRQIYTDAWRIMRDWFYEPGMHQVDWKAMHDKYQPLVANVANRVDLDFLIGEMIGEINVGHAYVERGETPSVARVGVGLLGCSFSKDGERYRFADILAGENWDESTRSPLTEPGVNVNEGDYLLAIDGQDLTTRDNPYRMLENKVGEWVSLLVNDKADKAGAREVRVRTIASEQELRYRDWVARNAALVDRLSNGRIGYIHAPNTAVEGHHRFFEDFRPQAGVKEALIIDDRYNGGGFIPDRMAQALANRPWNYWVRRGTELYTTPDFAFNGPMAMLINGYSSSGGDAFPYFFRKLGLGPLIGKKTWGGLVGYSGSPRFIDGGGLAVPAFAFVNTDGQWDVEYVGVAPDIDVFDDPTLVRLEREPTIEKAIEYLLAELEKRGPVKKPPVPPGPDRRR